MGGSLNAVILASALAGKHVLTLQWLTEDFKNAGTLTITDAGGGTYDAEGAQDGKGTDKLRMKGKITGVTADGFTFDGHIETQVSYLNKGELCARDGKVTFKTKGGRKYWRMQEMRNPCQPPAENVVDYIDVFKAAR